MTDMDLLPAATMGVFEHNREPTQVLDVLLPGQGVDQIAEALLVDDARNIFVVREGNGFWARNAKLGKQGCSEEFIICCPHEWIVDHVRALKHRIFEVRAIIGYFMRDPVYDDRKGRNLVHARATKLSIFSDYTLRPLVHLLDKGWGPGPFTTNDHTDFEHNA